VFEEVEWARQQLRKTCASTLNVAGKPIETTAAEIVRMMNSRFGDEARQPTAKEA
jgi:regulator of PEP synthase PpsR (kinase-PPPase family)